MAQGEDRAQRYVERYRNAGYDDERILRELVDQGLDESAVKAALRNGSRSVASQRPGADSSATSPSQASVPQGSGCMYPPCGRCHEGYLLPFFIKDGTNFYSCTKCGAMFGPANMVDSLIGFEGDVTSGRAKIKYMIPP